MQVFEDREVVVAQVTGGSHDGLLAGQRGVFQVASHCQYRIPVYSVQNIYQELGIELDVVVLLQLACFAVVLQREVIVAGVTRLDGALEEIGGQKFHYGGDGSCFDVLIAW